jgi:hypothetical protein
MISRSAASLVAAALLASASAAMLTAQAPGRVEVRALVGAAVPLGPSEFSDRWDPGPGGAISVGYAALARTTISAEFGYSRYPEQELALPTGGIPGQFGARSSPTTLWSAWLDGSHRFLSGGIQPRLHGGIGAVAFGATRTGLGLRLGAGVDVPIASRLAMVFDATFAHAFVPSSSGHALDTSYSYLPLRVGVSWQ